MTDAISRSQAIEGLHKIGVQQTRFLSDWVAVDDVEEMLASLPVVAPEGVCDIHPFEHQENQYRVTTCNFTHNTYEFECRNWRELPSAPVVAPQRNFYEPCDPCKNDDHDNCTGDCPSMCCALAAYEKAEVAPVVAGELTDEDGLITIEGICQALHRRGDYMEAGNNPELAEVYDAAAEMIMRGVLSLDADETFPEWYERTTKPVPSWATQARQWAADLGGEDGTELHAIIMAHFFSFESAPVEGREEK